MAEKIILWGTGMHTRKMLKSYFVPMDVIEEVIDANKVWREGREDNMAEASGNFLGVCGGGVTAEGVNCYGIKETVGRKCRSAEG